MFPFLALRTPRALSRVTLLAMMLAVSACGGGGGGGTAAAPPVASVQAPAIATQPAPQTVAVGQAATFSVAATGDGLSYQWQRNGADIAGATAATYVLNNAQASDDGSRFTVVVRNAGGSATSAAATLQVRAGQLSLLAGGIGGPGDMDGPVGRFLRPTNVAASPSGELWVNDFEAASGLKKITPVAGGAATVTALPRNEPWVVRVGAVDAAGNRYENWWTAIHKTTPAGVRTLLAGNPKGPGTADGAGAGAGFGAITGMAVDPGGNVYLADYLNATIRKVSPAGVVTTLAGVAGQTGTQDGAGAAARFRKPVALALDKAGNVYVDDDSVVRKITPAGVVSTLASVPRWPPAPDDFFPQNPEPSSIAPVVGGLAVGADGSVYILSGNIRRVSPEGAVTNFAGNPYTWGKYSSMTQDAAGNMYVVNPDQAAIFRVTPAGDIGVLAGLTSNAGFADGIGAAARFQPVASAAPALIADATGNVTLGEGERVRKITAGGLVSTLALPAVDGSGAPIKYFVSGLVYGKDLLAYSSGLLRSVDMKGNATGAVSVRIADAEDLIVAPNGSIYFRAWEKPQPLVFKAYVRRINPEGTVVTLPVAQEPRFTSWFADRDGSVVMADANGGVLRMAPDGSTSVLRAGAAANDPRGVYGPVAADRSGNLYIAEINVVRKITPAGTETIVAGTPAILGVRPGPLPASLNRISALAVGEDGNIYVESENAILKLTQ